MDRLEKLKLAKEKGYTYDELTGLIKNKHGKVITSKNCDGYIQIQLYEKIESKYKSYQVYGHQFAWFYMNNEIVDCIDHINQIKNDNRIENLRSVTRLQNQWNHKERKGYTFYKRDNNWKAQISIKGKVIHIGYYNTEEEAKEAYQKYKLEMTEIIFKK